MLKMPASKLRALKLDQRAGTSIGGFVVGYRARMNRCSEAGTIVGIHPDILGIDGPRVVVQFDSPQPVDAPEGAVSTRFELDWRNITSTWRDARYDALLLMETETENDLFRWSMCNATASTRKYRTHELDAADGYRKVYCIKYHGLRDDSLISCPESTAWWESAEMRDGQKGLVEADSESLFDLVVPTKSSAEQVSEFIAFACREYGIDRLPSMTRTVVPMFVVLQDTRPDQVQVRIAALQEAAKKIGLDLKLDALLPPSEMRLDGDVSPDVSSIIDDEGVFEKITESLGELRRGDRPTLG